MQSILVLFALCLPPGFNDYFTTHDVDSMRFSVSSYDSIVSWSQVGSLWTGQGGEPTNRKAYVEKVLIVKKEIWADSISLKFVSAICDTSGVLLAEDTVRMVSRLVGSDSSISVNGTTMANCPGAGIPLDDTLRDAGNGINAVKVAFSECEDTGFAWLDDSYGLARLSVVQGARLGGGTGYLIVSYTTRVATLTQFDGRAITFSDAMRTVPHSVRAGAPHLQEETRSVFNLQGQSCPAGVRDSRGRRCAASVRQYSASRVH